MSLPKNVRPRGRSTVGRWRSWSFRAAAGLVVFPVPRQPEQAIAEGRVRGAGSAVGAVDTGGAACKVGAIDGSNVGSNGCHVDRGTGSVLALLAATPRWPDVNPRQLIDESPMSGYQWRLVALCVVLNVLDGFDVVSAAFTASSLAEEFGTSGSELGVVISAAFVGMAAGSMLLSPVGDRYGRRPVTLFAFALCVVGPLLAATAGSYIELALWRFVTGAGVGGALACATVLVSEYSSRRWRPMALSVFLVGTSIGMAGGGAVATMLNSALGWRSVFLVSGVVGAVFLLVLVAGLPESISYLMARRPVGGLDRINRFLRRCGHRPVSGWGQEPDALSGSSASRTELFGMTGRRSTLLLWVAFFAIMSGNYFATNWTPYLLASAGMGEVESAAIGIMIPLGGMFGSLLYGVLAMRWTGRGLNAILLASAAVGLLVFTLSTAVLAVVYVFGILVGVLLSASITGLYAVAAEVYTAGARNAGIGMALGVGRVAGIIAPLVVGVLLDANWTIIGLGTVFAAVTLIGGVAVGGIPTRSVGRAELVGDGVDRTGER